MKYFFFCGVTFLCATISFPCLAEENVSTKGDCSPVILNSGGDAIVICGDDACEKIKEKMQEIKMSSIFFEAKKDSIITSKKNLKRSFKEVKNTSDLVIDYRKNKEYYKEFKSLSRLLSESIEFIKKSFSHHHIDFDKDLIGYVPDGLLRDINSKWESYLIKNGIPDNLDDRRVMRWRLIKNGLDSKFFNYFVWDLLLFRIEELDTMIYELNQAADTRKSKMNAVPDKLWEELNYASPSELERAINANQGILTQHAHRMRLLEDDLTIVRLELDKNSSIKNKLVSLNNYRNCKK